MSILPASGVGDVSTGFYPHEIDQSLRFDGSTSKLEKTPSSDGNRKKWTSSWWVKRAKLGALQYMWSGASYYGNDGIAALYFESDDKIHMYFDANTHPYGAINSRVYRDTTNWYHIVWAVDAENTVAKVWVNGVEETNAIQPPNFSYGMNKSGTKMGFGLATWGGSPNYNGYLAEFVHLDGQYLDETYFGEFINGVWVPKNIYNQSFTFGTNGFYLPFSNSSNIGYDYQTSDRSGTTNDYTATGLASTDVVPDSCTNNFCILNTTDKSGGTLSEGSLRYDTSTWDMATGTFLLPSGKWYYEVRVDESVSAKAFSVGIIEASRRRRSGNSYYWSSTNWSTSSQGYLYGVNVNGTTEYKISAGSAVSISSHPDIVQNSVIGIFIDLESSTTSIKYNVDGGTPFELFTGMQDTDYVIGTSNYQVQLTFNFGQDSTFAGQETAGGNTDANGKGDFHSALPSSHTDYLAICSSNLPDTTISPSKSSQADDHFETQIWSGDSSSTRDITSYGFQPDWSWIKNRTAGNIHILHDSPRGVSSSINTAITSNNTCPEGLGVNHTSTTVYGGVSAFLSNGFTLKEGSTDARYVNKTSNNYVGWSWKAGGEPTADNSAGAGNTPTSNSVKIDGSNLGSALAGTIPATRLSANTTAGFSIVTYTGTGTLTDTVAHGLGVVPEMYMVKSRSEAQNWHVYHHNNHATDPEDYVLVLNVNNDLSPSSNNYWNSTAPTTTVVSVGDDNSSNKNGTTYVMYCFAGVDGFSKFGKYNPNGSTDGTYIHLGFTPAFFMAKSLTANGYEWVMIDNKRTTNNQRQGYLRANEHLAENTSYNYVDFLSNGIKIRAGANQDLNNSSHTLIYMAFAQNPFKFSNAI